MSVFAIILESSSAPAASTNVWPPNISFSCDDKELSSLDVSVISVIKDSDKDSSKCCGKEELETEGSVDGREDDVMQLSDGDINIDSEISQPSLPSPFNSFNCSLAKKLLFTLESSLISSRRDRSSALVPSS